MKYDLHQSCFAVAKGEQGNTAIEYALLVFLISVVVVSSFGLVGQSLDDAFSNSFAPLPSDQGGPPTVSSDDPPDVHGPPSFAGG